MDIPPGSPAAAETECDLLSELFSPAERVSPAERADPYVILRDPMLPGCQYLFMRDMLRDPRFAAPGNPPSPEPAFQLLTRWMIRLSRRRGAGS